MNCSQIIMVIATCVMAIATCMMVWFNRKLAKQADITNRLQNVLSNESYLRTEIRRMQEEKRRLYAYYDGLGRIAPPSGKPDPFETIISPEMQGFFVELNPTALTTLRDIREEVEAWREEPILATERIEHLRSKVSMLSELLTRRISYFDGRIERAESDLEKLWNNFWR